MKDWIRVKIDNETLNLDTVNCVEIGICYCLGIYGREYQDYFLLFLKLIQSYIITGFADASIVIPVDIHPYIQSILNEQLQVHINFHEFLDDSFYDQIEHIIGEGRPVIITGNLRELYYSSSFMSKDSRHVFLINGFDREKKIFRVIDGEQFYIRKKCRYNEFSIPYQTVKEMVLSYRRAFGEYFFCDFQRKKMKFDKVLTMRNCLSFYSYTKELREITYIEAAKNVIAKGIKDYGNIDIMFLRTIRYKELFYTQLACGISKILGRDESVGEILRLKDQMLPIWKDICNTCLLGLYKTSLFYIEEKLNAARNYELQIDNIIKALIL